MSNTVIFRCACLVLCLAAAIAQGVEEPTDLPKAFIDGTGPGWQDLGGSDFVRVNCDPQTWTFEDGLI